VFSNFPQFLNLNFVNQFNSSKVAPAAAALSSSSGGLFDPEKIALLGQRSSTTAGEAPTGNPDWDVASMLMANTGSSAATYTVSNPSAFSIVG
jgi:hypothetical protein